MPSILEEWDSAEVAQELGLTMQAVRQGRYRERKRLREELSET
ncbi:MAG: hypothetical protein R3C05_26320 [Pirellulaceae bacterium]